MIFLKAFGKPDFRTLRFYELFEAKSIITVYTVVPAFNGPSNERTPAMLGHFLDVRTVLPC